MANPKGNPQNLQKSTPNQARKNGRKGGIVSAQKRAEKKLLKETLEILLSAEKDGKTMQDNICISIVKRAAAGDIKAAEFIRDTIGQKPENINKTEISGGIDITALMERGRAIASNTD